VNITDAVLPQPLVRLHCFAPRTKLVRGAKLRKSVRWHPAHTEEEADLAQSLRADVALVRLSFLVQSIYAETCAKHDLSPAQAQLLCVIKGQPRGMTELTRMLRLERPGLSGLVDRIERRGLVRRDPSGHDRRAVTLSPTSRGKEIVEAFYAEVSDRLLEIVAHLPANDRRQFERVATEIVFGECVPAVFGSTDDPRSGARGPRAAP
jgi:DNA-binding MarR family transcriptional regulator